MNDELMLELYLHTIQWINRIKRGLPSDTIQHFGDIKHHGLFDDYRYVHNKITNINSSFMADVVHWHKHESQNRRKKLQSDILMFMIYW